MTTISVFILSVAAVIGNASSIQAPAPHKYYADDAACQKAGKQWVRTVSDANKYPSGSDRRKLGASYNCEKQTIAIFGN